MLKWKLSSSSTQAGELAGVGGPSDCQVQGLLAHYNIIINIILRSRRFDFFSPLEPGG